jgi:hypothetical protein
MFGYVLPVIPRSQDNRPRSYPQPYPVSALRSVATTSLPQPYWWLGWPGAGAGPPSVGFPHDLGSRSGGDSASLAHGDAMAGGILDAGSSPSVLEHLSDRHASKRPGWNSGELGLSRDIGPMPGRGRWSGRRASESRGLRGVFCLLIRKRSRSSCSAGLDSGSCGGVPRWRRPSSRQVPSSGAGPSQPDYLLLRHPSH